MSYTKQNWNTGETITADKLNHMEDGIAEASEEASDGGAFYIDLEYMIDGGDYSATSCSAFAEEINTEYQKGKTIILRTSQTGTPSLVNVGQLTGLSISDNIVTLFGFNCLGSNLRVMIGADLAHITIVLLS